MKTPKTILLTLVFGLMALTAGAQTKIATIDLRKVFDEYYKTRLADASLKEKASDLDKQRKNMIEDYKKANDDYKRALDGANDQAVSAEEREKRKKGAESKLIELKDLEQQITQFDNTARTNLDEQQRRLRDNILTEIRAVINTKAKTGNLTMVLDTSSEDVRKPPVVLFNTGENDLTEVVLKQLNAAAPPGSLSTEGKKEEKK
jgi:outer membrane protein